MNTSSHQTSSHQQPTCRVWDDTRPQSLSNVEDRPSDPRLKATARPLVLPLTLAVPPWALSQESVRDCVDLFGPSYRHHCQAPHTLTNWDKWVVTGLNPPPDLHHSTTSSSLTALSEHTPATTVSADTTNQAVADQQVPETRRNSKRHRKHQSNIRYRSRAWTRARRHRVSV